MTAVNMELESPPSLASRKKLTKQLRNARLD